jgi:hypothetical protein
MCNAYIDLPAPGLEGGARTEREVRYKSYAEKQHAKKEKEHG